MAGCPDILVQSKVNLAAAPFLIKGDDAAASSVAWGIWQQT